MDSISDTYIFGRHPVHEQLLNKAGKIEKIFIREGLSGSYVQDITSLASQNRIPVSRVPGRKLFDLVGKVNDQGIVALVSPVTYLDFHEWIEDLKPDLNTAVLILDEIEDPHNFGAILRSAAAAGITAILVAKHRQAPVNATVYKTSAGTAGRIPIVRTVNLNQAILELKEHKFWISGLDQDADKTIWEMDADVPMGFVIGNEGRGVRRKTSEHCDFHYAIPMENNVESLNASVSAALVCYEWKRKAK